MSDFIDYFVIGPFAALLRFFYEWTGSYGLSIMLFAVVAKIVLLFFAFKGKKGMLKQQRLFPKQKELEKKCGNDKAKYQQELTKLYQDEGVSPMGGCLWNLLPLPLLFALYSVVREPLKNILGLSPETIEKIVGVLGIEPGAFSELHAAQAWFDNAATVAEKVPEVAGVVPMDFTLFHVFDLAKIPQLPWSGGWEWILLIPFLSAASSLLLMVFNQKLMKTQMQQQGKLLMYLMAPGMSLWFGFVMPAAMGLYWITQNLLQMIQEYFLTKHFLKVLDEEDAAKAALQQRRKEAEAKQREEDRQRRAERIAEKNKKHKPKKYKLQGKPNTPKVSSAPSDGDDEDTQN